MSLCSLAVDYRIPKSRDEYNLVSQVRPNGFANMPPDTQHNKTEVRQAHRE